jgi:tRNA nucleotidyltransferase (CCA-adding enzyme)
MKASALLLLAKSIMKTISDHGHVAYIVGGYVRDRLLNKDIKDIDLATSALPEEVMSWFDHTVPTGLQHGTVTVIISGVSFEVTTFRKEEEYVEHRRPSRVHFISDLDEDLKRRDFTINAMAMDINEKIIDPYNGQVDMKQGRLKTVGDPYERFKEDALRMMRCIRFASVYRLDIENATWEALCTYAPALKHIAMERVRMELEKTVEGVWPTKGLCLFLDSKLLQFCKEPLELPWDIWNKPDIRATTAVLDYLAFEARWVYLIHMSGLTTEQARSFFQTLTFSKKRTDELCKIIEFKEWMFTRAGREADYTKDDLKEAVVIGAVSMGTAPAVIWIELLKQIHVLGALTSIMPGWNDSLLKLVIAHGMEWVQGMPVSSVKELDIGGQELQLIAPPGPWMRIVLDKLLVDTALQRIPNQKASLLKQAERCRREMILE